MMFRPFKKSKNHRNDIGLKAFRTFLKSILIAVPMNGPVLALESPLPPTPAPTLAPESQNPQLKKLELENEKLRSKMEKLEILATRTAQQITPLPAPSSPPPASPARTAPVYPVHPTENTPPVSGGPDDDERRKETELFQKQTSQKAGLLAKRNHSKENLLVVDFVNAEVWNRGARYYLYDMAGMAKDRHWAVTDRAVKFAPNGDLRLNHQIQNVSLLRYESRPRGVLTFLEPVQEDDFRIATPEGLSFDSSMEAVRNACQNDYFTFEGENWSDGLRTLKYVHKVPWDFSDRLEFSFDKRDKLVKIRYGVLDEH